MSMYQTKLSQVISVEQEIYYVTKLPARSLLARQELFTPYEQKYCHQKSNPLLSAAGMWCAKQAFVKATTHKLGLADINYLDLEIHHHPSGQPQILWKGALERKLQPHSINAALAISHTKTLAAAIVLLWRI